MDRQVTSAAVNRSLEDSVVCCVPPPPCIFLLTLGCCDSPNSGQTDTKHNLSQLQLRTRTAYTEVFTRCVTGFRPAIVCNRSENNCRAAHAPPVAQQSHDAKPTRATVAGRKVGWEERKKPASLIACSKLLFVFQRDGRCNVMPRRKPLATWQALADAEVCVQ